MWTPKAGSSDDGLYRLQETTGRTTYEVWMQFLYTLFFSLLPSLMFTYKMIYRAWPAVKTIQVRIHFTGVRILQKHRFGAVSIEYRFRFIWLCSSGLYHFIYGHFLTTDTLKVFPNQKLWWKCLLSAQSTGWCKQVGDRLAYSNDKRDLKSCADIFNIPLSSPHALIDTCHHKAGIQLWSASEVCSNSHQGLHPHWSEQLLVSLNCTSCDPVPFAACQHTSERHLYF